MAFYGLVAVLIAMAAAGMLLDLRAFARLARAIRQGGRDTPHSFAEIAAIPELRPVAREFDRMVATLDASARALREAAEDNAHAFKAPIAVVTQALEPLRRAAGQDERGVRAVAVVEQALARLGGLVNAARHLDEEAAALMDARLQPVDLAALAAQMAASFDRADAERGVRVVARTPGPARVMATTDSLETVIENLLDNAIGFSPTGGTVTVTVTRKDGEVWLAVADQGPGVPAGQMEHIFRRSFSYRPGASDGAPHSGIGLAVVRRTVELLGGTARAENLPGAGLRVTLVLPAA
jgi:two-component system sensor histidine kinase ChvG